MDDVSESASENTVELAFDVFDPPEPSNAKRNPIILLHGLYMNRTIYKPVAKELSKQTNRKVYCPDLRSHGNSPYPKETGIYPMAEDVKRFMKDNKIEKSTLVCHSFSSRIASIIAITQPQFVEKLVFVDILPYSEDNERTLLRKTFFEEAGKLFSKFNASLTLEKAKLLLKVAASKFLIKNNQLGIDVYCSCITSDQNGVRPFFDFENINEKYLNGKLTLEEPLGVYEGEVLFIVGLSPNNLLRDKSEDHLKYFPNMKEVAIKDADHMLMLDKTNEFVSEVATFLNS